MYMEEYNAWQIRICHTVFLNANYYMDLRMARHLLNNLDSVYAFVCSISLYINSP